MKTTYPNHQNYNGLTAEEVVEVEVEDEEVEKKEDCLVPDDGGLH